MMLSRRSFFSGLVAAPAVIRIPGLLMPVKALPEEITYYSLDLASGEDMSVFTLKVTMPEGYRLITWGNVKSEQIDWRKLT